MRQVTLGGENKFFLVGQLDGRRHLRRIRCRQKDDTEMDLTERGWEVWSGFV